MNRPECNGDIGEWRMNSPMTEALSGKLEYIHGVQKISLRVFWYIVTTPPPLPTWRPVGWTDGRGNKLH